MPAGGDLTLNTGKMHRFDYRDVKPIGGYDDHDNVMRIFVWKSIKLYFLCVRI